MTQSNEPPEPTEPTGPTGPPPSEPFRDPGEQRDLGGAPPPPPPPYSHQPYQPPTYQQPAYGQGPYGQEPYGQGGHVPGVDPAAPYGVHPLTGVPYSDKSKLIAGLLQIIIPLGIGRMYIGDTRTGVIQLVVTLVTCGIGALWPFIDGIMMLVGDPVDAHGRPLRS